MPDESNKRKAVSSSRIVVKVGSALLFSRDTGAVNRELMDHLASEAQQLRQRGFEIILVSSGAIALGSQAMKLERPPSRMPDRQAMAAVGQSLLMSAWRDAFSAQGICVSQVLLTHDDLSNRKRYLNASQAMEAMLKYGVVPIVNENDTVSVEEIRLGDNDRLSSLVAAFTQSSALLILSTASALFDKDPSRHGDARRIPVVEEISSTIQEAAKEGVSQWGRGGMATKVEAAKSASSFGIPTFVACGLEPNVLTRLIEGEDLGTWFAPRKTTLSGRKHWIAHTLKEQGVLHVDVGAERAIFELGKSLLPSGVLAVDGEFERGDCVLVMGPNHGLLARGLIGYDARELRDIAGKNSGDIEKVLGYRGTDEVIHRNDLVLEKHR